MTPIEQQQLVNRVREEAQRFAATISLPPDAVLGDCPGLDTTWISLRWREVNDGDDQGGWYLALMRNEAGAD